MAVGTVGPTIAIPPPLVATPRRPHQESVVRALDFVLIAMGVVVCGPRSSGVWAYAVLVALNLHLSGAHRPNLQLSALEEIPKLLSLLSIPFLLLFPLLDSRWLTSANAGRIAVIPGLVLIGRLLAYPALRAAHRRGWLISQVLLVGGGRVTSEVCEALRDHPEYGMRVVGYVDGENWALPAPRLGGVEDLPRILHNSSVHRVVFGFSSTREGELLDAMRTVATSGCQVLLVPRFFDVGRSTGTSGTDEIAGIPLERVRPFATRIPGWRLKRAVDVVVSAVGLLAVSPLLAVAALGVRLSSRGPIFFRQPRVGYRGREFEMLKFRTLYAEASSHDVWSTVTSSSLTPAGRVLRATNVDELPQLWNVLRGAMSLVGPRPERTYFVNKFWDTVPGYPERHRVPAGITGWAQVHGLRGDTRIPQRAKLDNRYIDDWSPWREIVILIRTTSAFLHGSR